MVFTSFLPEKHFGPLLLCLIPLPLCWKHIEHAWGTANPNHGANLTITLTLTMEHGGILSMPDLNFILIFDQNDVFDHFPIFTPFLRLIFAMYFVVT